MRIALDATYSLASEPSGVAVYCRRIVEELTALQPGTLFWLAYRANRFWRALGEAKPGPNCRRAPLEEFVAPLWAGRADLFHGLNQRLPRTRFRRTVATFHDLFVMTGEYSTPEFRARFSDLARRTAERADRIVAVSDFTAEQTARLLGYPRERIVTVHHGVDPPAEFPPEELSAFRRSLGLETPFLLHVGAMQTRKNCERLVEAFETLPPPLQLVFAGGRGYGAEATLARIAASPARARIRVLGYVDSATRAKLYRSAAALAFPSLDEGFGLPVLEAMAAGLPALVSDRSALPEVAGDAALAVDPFSAEAIRDGLAKLLWDEDLRGLLRRRGRSRAARFSWRRAAERTWSVYRDLLELARSPVAG